MRRLTLALAVALLALPAGARAATVSVEGGTLSFTPSGTGEPNHPTFHHRAENELVVYDPRFPGRSVTAGPGCAQDGDNTVVCPGAGVTRAEFALGERGGDEPADSLTLTEAVPVPVSVRAAVGSGARVSYLDERPLRAFLDGVANDGPEGRGDDIGPGIDHVTTGDGADLIGGDERANSLDGSDGPDGVAGAGGDDTITLASYDDVGADAVGLETQGADSASCGPGFDTIYLDDRDRAGSGDCELVVLVVDDGYSYGGRAGPDRIIADRGPAIVDGRGGDDRLGATRFVGEVILYGGAGDDRLAGNVGDDRLEGGTGDDSIAGAEGADRIVGNRGRDSLSGGAGSDSIFARDGFTDTVRCGSGRDTVSADRRDRVSRDCERVRR